MATRDWRRRLVVDRGLDRAATRLGMTIPVTVFTGFLGAGKTSIILSLLPQLPREYRVVLLKNEFGEIEGCHIPIALLSSADTDASR